MTLRLRQFMSFRLGQCMRLHKLMIMRQGGVKTKHEGLKVPEGMGETLREG
jgi:hypothetical protein